jgi:hypothetical protein
MNDFKRLYRTMDIWKAQLLTSALEDSGIACYHQQGYTSGLELSPFTISAPIIAENIVYVAGDREAEAKEILEQMPFDRDEENPPINLHEKVDPEMKSMVKWLYAAFLGLPFIIVFIMYFFRHFIRF